MGRRGRGGRGAHRPALRPQRAAPAGARLRPGAAGDSQRKNGWQLAEALGDATPDGVRHLLAPGDWDADAVRGELTRYVAETLGSPGGALVVDETGFLKKGTKLCDAARQYTGTAGRVESAQVGVFLTYAGAKSHELIDRALDLPREWAGDPDRRAEVGVPEGVAFATKVRCGAGPASTGT